MTQRSEFKGDFIGISARYENSFKEEVLSITANTLIVGTDIAKSLHWARFVDFQGTTGKPSRWLEKQEGLKVVLVNTYTTKQAKKLDDNSQTKCDKKDALTIARLVKDGLYLNLYMPF